MKTLVVCYSRDGHTKKIGQKIAEILAADFEEIIDLKKRFGFWSYLFAGRDAMREKMTDIKETQKNPADYDLIIVGTPIWGWNMTPAVRTYLSQNKGKFKNMAFFVTQGGSGAERAFESMAKVSGLAPKATLTLKTSEVVSEQYLEKVKNFTGQIKF